MPDFICQPHPEDLDGYVAVRTDLGKVLSCSVCALRSRGGGCRAPAGVPCLSWLRPDGEPIHYKKAKKAKKAKKS